MRYWYQPLLRNDNSDSFCSRYRRSLKIKKYLACESPDSGPLLTFIAKLPAIIQPVAADVVTGGRSGDDASLNVAPMHSDESSKMVSNVEISFRLLKRVFVHKKFPCLLLRSVYGDCDPFSRVASKIFESSLVGPYFLLIYLAIIAAGHAPGIFVRFLVVLFVHIFRSELYQTGQGILAIYFIHKFGEAHLCIFKPVVAHSTEIFGDGFINVVKPEKSKISSTESGIPSVTGLTHHRSYVALSKF